jgi:D-alanyl-D-alanine carboxypeptidase
MLKEMNRNSNNLAAVEIFNRLGGPVQFSQFIKKDLNLGPEAILFYEGSGNRVASEARYNEASCRALLQIFKSLDSTLTSIKYNISHVVSLVGQEGLVSQGTPYSNDLTYGQVVAKTGTIDVSVTLGGVLNTQPQKTYFMFNVKPRT